MLESNVFHGDIYHVKTPDENRCCLSLFSVNDCCFRGAGFSIGSSVLDVSQHSIRKNIFRKNIDIECSFDVFNELSRLGCDNLLNMDRKNSFNGFYCRHLLKNQLLLFYLVK